MRFLKPFFGLLFIFLITACGPSAQEQAKASASSEAIAAEVMAELYGPDESEKAQGFMDGGDGVIVRFMTDLEKSQSSCTYRGTCGHVVIKTKKDCPSGVYVELAGYDASGSIVGKGNEWTTGMSKGETAKLSIWLSNGKKYKIKEVDCH